MPGSTLMQLLGSLPAHQLQCLPNLLRLHLPRIVRQNSV